jgi:imidazolonepropionase-like amidohydrolase
MKIFIAFLLLLPFGLWAQTPIDSRQRPLVITHVNVIPMDAERVLADQTVVIEQGKIKAMGTKVSYGKNALVIDGKGKYLIPGLAEMHAHVPPADDLEPAKEVIALFAANGITTIRGMLGHPRHLALRGMLQRHEIIGPDLYTAGPSFNGMSITSPAAGADLVRKQKAAGYDFLKLHPGLTREKFDTIAFTARQVGIPFIGHVSSGVGIWHAIKSGYSSIDHLDGFVEGLVPGIERMSDQQIGLFGVFVADQADTNNIPALIQGLKTGNTWVVPTQALAERWIAPGMTPEAFRAEAPTRYMKKETVNQWCEAKTNLASNPLYNPEAVIRYVKLRRRLILACQQQGVGLLLGSDAPQVFNVPGFSAHQELEYLVRAGLTPYQALRTGTVNVATYLHHADAGVVKTGNVADLILLNGNPLTDITQTRKIDGVMMHGYWLSRAYLDQELRKLEK